ncbi:unnamed protein product [Cuscuta epithymum]|uniref:Uncharacterized protein n=1 Tax=Cuscuta epithymum TaxID=186058 RepID=A0AAV0DT59_9ASTE|nr:unnamed protein product [Cuscuta epithymum]
MPLVSCKLRESNNADPFETFIGNTITLMFRVVAPLIKPIPIFRWRISQMENIWLLKNEVLEWGGDADSVEVFIMFSPWWINFEQVSKFDSCIICLFHFNRGAVFFAREPR